MGNLLRVAITEQCLQIVAERLADEEPILIAAGQIWRRLGCFESGDDEGSKSTQPFFIELEWQMSILLYRTSLEINCPDSPFGYLCTKVEYAFL